MAGQANDEDRLPWLEPYREPKPAPARRGKAKLKAVESAPLAELVEVLPPMASTKPAKPASARNGVPLAAWLATAIAVVGLAAGGGYWIGHRNSPVGVTAAPTVTIPVAKVEPIPMPEIDAAEDDAQAATTPSPARVHRTASKARRVVHRRPVHVSHVTVPPSRPKAAPPLPKAMAVRLIRQGSAGQPGTVVDLGRYLTPRMADTAFRTTAGRYPYLGTLKRVVVPLPATYGQPRLYALQLGAKSSREARQLCQNLLRIGRPCEVQ